MDMESAKQQFIAAVRKYQYVLLAVLIGVFLMLLPSRAEHKKTESQVPEVTVPDLERELAEILSRIAGVGKTEVLLTELSGSSTIYQMDTGMNQSNSDTVVIMDQNREEKGLVKQIIPPIYKGAVIVCQGGDNAKIRLEVVEAVKSVTGLSSDCITVLKMK